MSCRKLMGRPWRSDNIIETAAEKVEALKDAMEHFEV